MYSVGKKGTLTSNAGRRGENPGVARESRARRLYSSGRVRPRHSNRDAPGLRRPSLVSHLHS